MKTGNRRADGQPLANLSRYHPDYGMTPQEHEAKKALRLAGKVKFVPKEQAKTKGKKRRR